MRIIYFSKSYTPHDHRFLRSLSLTEHDVAFLQLEPIGRKTEDREVPKSIDRITWAGGRQAFQLQDAAHLSLDLQRVIHEFAPDIIHAGPIQSCAFLAALSGFPRLLTMSWGYDLIVDASKDALLQWVTQYTLQRSAFFTSDSRFTREKAVTLGMDPRKTVVFPWGVDIEQFMPMSRDDESEMAQEDVEMVTFFCSRTWEAIYGVDVLIDAFVKVARQFPCVSLNLLGGGSMETRIRGTIQSAGLLDRVTFGGHVSQRDLPQWYGRSDVYVSPSHVDGTSVTLLEAMASGLPCLVSDIPGNLEWVREGINGWTFRDGDVDNLAEKMISVVRARETFRSIGIAARQTAEDRANWNINFGSLLEAYRVVAAQRSG